MYNIKIYTKGYVFKKTLSPTQVECSYKFSITKKIGWGDFSFNYYGEGINHADIVKVYKDGNLLYSGFVDTITRSIDSGGDKYVIKVTGLAGLLSYVYTGVQNWTDKTISEMLLALFAIASSQGYVFDTSGIEPTTEVYSLKIDASNSGKSVLEKILSLTNMNFYITDKVYLTNNYKTHRLTFQNTVSSITIEESNRDLFNKHYVNYNSGSYVGENLASQQLYGIRAKFIADSQIVNEPTAQQRINILLNETSQPRYSTKIVVNNKYPLETIMPGDLVQIGNIDLGLSVRPIEKVNYDMDSVSIDLDCVKDFDSVIAELKKNS